AAGDASRATDAERVLATRAIDTLLREDYGGLSRRVRCRDGAAVLDLPGRGGRDLALPLERDGFLADFRLLRTAAGLPAAPLGLDDVDAAVAAVSDPRDAAGVAAFAAECRQALAGLRLKERHQPGALSRLARMWRAEPAARLGWRGLPGYEAVAASLPHPAYPTSEAKPGFSDADALRYAPEFGPEFALCWVAVPRSRLTVAGQLGARAVIAPGTGLRVTPTLSTRTVALTGQPGTHLKLPLPTSTLGLLNRRSIGLGTLTDGALVRGLLAAACRADPQLDGLLLADESSYAHAGHPFLAYLLRRLPAGLGRHRIVPVAALTAPSTDAAAGTGRPLVIEELADWAWHGDLVSLFTAYLRTLFGVQVRLFTRYGIALES